MLNVQNANNVLWGKSTFLKNCNSNSLKLCKFLSCRKPKKTRSDRNCNKRGLKWPHLSHDSPTAPYCNLLLTASLQKLKRRPYLFSICASSWILSYQVPDHIAVVETWLLPFAMFSFGFIPFAKVDFIFDKFPSYLSLWQWQENLCTMKVSASQNWILIGGLRNSISQLILTNILWHR